MSQLQYFTELAVDELRTDIAERLDWYYKPTENLPDGWIRAENPVRTAPIDGGGIREQLKIGAQPHRDDQANAIAVYRALKKLTPHQASDERLWVYLSHTQCAQYVAKRWLRERPDDDEKAVQKVRNHFFARGNRALIRDNGVSRLWWLGSIAHRIDPDDPQVFLEILLHKQDVRSALVERPAISMNPAVLKAIYAVMRGYWEKGAEKAPLFVRNTFRTWMINLNRRGGVILLDALSEYELERLLRSEAQRAIAEARANG